MVEDLKKLYALLDKFNNEFLRYKEFISENRESREQIELLTKWIKKLESAKLTAKDSKNLPTRIILITIKVIAMIITIILSILAALASSTLVAISCISFGVVLTSLLAISTTSDFYSNKKASIENYNRGIEDYKNRIEKIEEERALRYEEFEDFKISFYSTITNLRNELKRLSSITKDSNIINMETELTEIMVRNYPPNLIEQFSEGVSTPGKTIGTKRINYND